MSDAVGCCCCHGCVDMYLLLLLLWIEITKYSWKQKKIEKKVENSSRGVKEAEEKWW